MPESHQSSLLNGSEWVSHWQAFPMIGLGSDKKTEIEIVKHQTLIVGHQLTKNERSVMHFKLIWDSQMSVFFAWKPLLSGHVCGLFMPCCLYFDLSNSNSFWQEEEIFFRNRRSQQTSTLVEKRPMAFQFYWWFRWASHKEICCRLVWLTLKFIHLLHQRINERSPFPKHYSGPKRNIINVFLRFFTKEFQMGI